MGERFSQVRKWKVGLEEIRNIGEEVATESRILGDESYDSLQAQYSRLVLRGEVYKELVKALKEKVTATQYPLGLFKAFVVGVSQVDPFTTRLCTPEDYVLNKFDERMESLYPPAGDFDQGRLSRLQQTMIRSHDVIKMVDELRSRAEDVQEALDAVRSRWDNIKDVDKESIGQVLEACKKS